MRLLIQRVKEAAVAVDGKQVSAIKQGLLVFVGVFKGDTKAEADHLARKCAALRIFEDADGKMNLSVKDINGSVLAVSQFTLAGDTSRGNRPGFDYAARPDLAEPLYEYFCRRLREESLEVKTGIFRADMQVSLINDGPVTFVLDRMPQTEPRNHLSDKPLK